MRFLLTTILNAIAVWLVSLLPGITVTAYKSDNEQLALVLTYLLIAVLWGLVNSVIGRVVKTISLPLYCLTLGLFALVVNGLLFWIVGWISGLLGFGLSIDSFGWAVVGAILLSLLSAVLNGLFNHEEDDAR
ncbi:phage holin family protein [uncultured Gulosibacter sp.]|uniref:phage holin family protein n=1 Tax=uncultured Gulosibacter sp. TaxID=1339167 RepID=UPI002889DE33|nr:phage holin family protein [uncultured Gulosibacter sp.]